MSRANLSLRIEKDVFSNCSNLLCSDSPYSGPGDGFLKRETWFVFLHQLSIENSLNFKPGVLVKRIRTTMTFDAVEVKFSPILPRLSFLTVSNTNKKSREHIKYIADIVFATFYKTILQLDSKFSLCSNPPRNDFLSHYVRLLDLRASCKATTGWRYFINVFFVS